MIMGFLLLFLVCTRPAKVVMQCWMVQEKLEIELSKNDVFLFPIHHP